MAFYQKSNPRKRELHAASNTPKLVRDTPQGRAKIAAAQTMLLIWALERGEPWSTSQPDTDRSIT